MPPPRAPDLKYGLCCRPVSSVFHLTGDISLNAVLESGHKNVGAAARIFEEAEAETNKFGINLLGAISFATKDCDELMLPDFVAYMALHFDRQIRSGRRQRSPPLTEGPIAFRQFDSTDPPHLEFRPRGLEDARAQLERRLAGRQARWSNPGRPRTVILTVIRSCPASLFVGFTHLPGASRAATGS